MSTLTATKRALYDLLCSDITATSPVSGLTRVANVYLGEPLPGNLLGPIAISVMTEEGTPTEDRFTVRVYGNITADAIQVQADLDVTIQEVRDLLVNAVGFVYEGFKIAYRDDLKCLVASFPMVSGRRDFPS